MSRRINTMESVVRYCASRSIGYRRPKAQDLFENKSERQKMENLPFFLFSSQPPVTFHVDTDWKADG